VVEEQVVDMEALVKHLLFQDKVLQHLHQMVVQVELEVVTL
jgi:hypothetical protein